MKIDNVKNLIIKKNLFLKLYVIAAIITLIIKLVFAIIDEDIILEVLRINVTNLIFASLYNARFFIVEVESVGPIAIFLILHIGAMFSVKLTKIEFLKSKIFYILVPIFGILLYFFIHFIVGAVLPFSIYEGLLCGTILFPIAKILKL